VSYETPPPGPPRPPRTFRLPPPLTPSAAWLYRKLHLDRPLPLISWQCRDCGMMACQPEVMEMEDILCSLCDNTIGNWRRYQPYVPFD
jgi:hypothetical protein